MFRLLEDAELPFLKGGDAVVFVGEKWSDDFKGKTFILTKGLIRRYARNIGILEPRTGVNFVAAGIVVQGLIEPINKDTFMEVRLGFPDQHIIHYLRQPAASIRGGLEEPALQTPVPGDPVAGYIGYYNYDDSPREAPRLVFHVVDASELPAFDAWNISNDFYAKLVHYYLVNSLKMRLASKAEVQAILEGKYPGVVREVFSSDVIPW